MKKIFLLSLIFILTGCSIDYNLTLDEELATENIKINSQDFYTFPTPAYNNVQGSSETDEKIPGVEYYDMNFNTDYSTASYKFPLNNFKSSRAVNTCYKALTLSKTSTGSRLLNTSNYNYCFDAYPNLDEINVNITISDNYTIINSNADSKNSNTHSWKINRDNYKSKYIQIEYKEKPKEEEPTPQIPEEPDTPVKESNTLTYILVLSVVGLFLIGIVGFIAYKSSNN